MKSKKRVVAVLLAIILVVTPSVVASAEIVRKTNANYGWLEGQISTGGVWTEIQKNPDNAYLSYSWTAVSSAGTTIQSNSRNSSRGATMILDQYSLTHPSIYAFYGTHGVQGGNKYQSDVVYTYQRK